MQYYVTIYIDILFEKDLLKLDVTHAFLGLTHIHPDKLDKIDSQTRMQKLKNADWKDFDKKWYEKIYPTINPYVLGYDSSNDEGFFGFGSATGLGKMLKDKFFSDGNAGKVFENNQYLVSPNSEDNRYIRKKLRNSNTFLSSNRCVLEISQEQYQTLFQSIQNDVYETSFVGSQGEIKNEKFIYDITNNNCVTWVLNKLDSIGIEIIDNEEWLPDNISIRDSLLMKFPYLKFYNTTFLKFQKIDSNLESIKGAKAFRYWARTMIENNYMCYVDENTLEKEVQVFCKRDTDNQKLYESIKKFYKTQAQLKSVYEKLGALLDKLLQKIDDENTQGDFELIYFDKQDKKIKILKAQNNYEPMEIAEFDLTIPANNYIASKFYPFIFIPKDTIAERILYHEYDYGKVSQGYQKDRNEFYYNILAGIQSDKYWSSSYHKLTKAYKQFQAKGVENV
ncbi:TPA: hypothetical protein SBV85_001901 [Campylobacter coli]|nr:hypothetical protein [Campylobacter coli]